MPRSQMQLFLGFWTGKLLPSFFENFGRTSLRIRSLNFIQVAVSSGLTFENQLNLSDPRVKKC